MPVYTIKDLVEATQIQVIVIPYKLLGYRNLNVN